MIINIKQSKVTILFRINKKQPTLTERLEIVYTQIENGAISMQTRHLAATS